MLHFEYQNGSGTVKIIGTSNNKFNCVDKDNNLITNNPIKCEIIELSKDIKINGSGLTWNDTLKPYTISLSDKIIFDGKNNIVFLNDCSGWQGLIKSDSDSSNNRPTISNIDISGNGNTYLSKNNDFHGTSYLMRYGSLYFDLKNCNNYIEIKDASYCGGLVPSYNNVSNSFVNITRCSNHGNIINSYYAGGICGSEAGNKGNCTITNSYNTGNIINNSEYAGGICGSEAGAFNGNCTITNSYNTGSISGSESAGGICGRFAGAYNGNCTITNSYNTGMITNNSDYAGGICGS